MNKTTRGNLTKLHSDDPQERYDAFTHVMKLTNEPVDWAYDVWDDLLAQLRHENNHQRAIAAQVLCGLAKSDPGKRILKDLAALLAVTRDERFVTARHALQSMWKVAVVSAAHRRRVVDSLAERFRTCRPEKNCTLIRYDILVVFRKVYDEIGDEGLRAEALALIETEPDAKYRRKYLGLWKK